MSVIHSAFRCVVMSPLGKLLDCMATSVVFPAHDGQVGIWHNHIPMLCKLGMGMMKIIPVPANADKPSSETLLFIDGGFVLLAENFLEVTAFDAISIRDTKAEKMQRLIKELEKSAAIALTPKSRHHYIRKILFLKQLAKQEL